MLLEIYNSMLKTASTQKPPKYIEHVFYISIEQSEYFWQNKDLKNEQEQLLKEWNPGEKSRYTKTFYGIRFAIQFQSIYKD